jgi:Tfp pilus assembly protein PilV
VHSCPYHFDVAWEPDQGQTPAQGGRHAGPARRVRRGTRIAVAALFIGIAVLGVSAYKVYTGLMPRKFTSAEQQQIMGWEVAARWRELPAGDIFPAKTTYPPPQVLADGGTLTLTASRLGIARQATCQQATDPAAAAALGRGGCEAILRATYVDGTGTFLVTVGVAAFPGEAQASAAQQALSDPRLTHAGQTNFVAPGVQAVAFPQTPGGGFTDARRQVSGSLSEGPYVVMYTIGYTDGRPKVPVAVDGYTYSEMTSLGDGLSSKIADALSVQPPVPHCPGAPGC